MHSVSRSMERMGLSKRDAERNIRKAMMIGRRAMEYTGRARKYLDKVVVGDAYAIVYEGFCYVIATYSGNCITTFRLPEWWKYEEQKRKAQTKYTRANSPYCDNRPAAR